MTFKRLSRTKLGDEERRCIWAAEAAHVRLRNIVHVSVVSGETDLDLVVMPEHQEAWRAEAAIDLTPGRRGNDKALRERYIQKFERTRKLPYATGTIELLEDDQRWVHGAPPAGNANYAWRAAA